MTIKSKISKFFAPITTECDCCNTYRRCVCIEIKLSSIGVVYLCTKCLTTAVNTYNKGMKELKKNPNL